MTTTRRPTDVHTRPTSIVVALFIAAAIVGCGTPASAGVDPATAPVVAPVAPTSTVVAPIPSFAAPTPIAPQPTTVSVTPTVTPPGPVVDTPPDPTPDPKPPRKSFAMNLYRSGDFVAQYTNEWCVGASLQMTLNMSTTKTRSSRASQRSLWRMAQARSFSPFGGANPRGWTAALNDLGVGPYVLVSIPDFDGALEVAAAAIRETKRPVGLVMWRGRHAWVMSGFESIGDPRVHDDIEVTGVRVLDPLYPNGSSRWGRSPKPNALLKPSTLARQFVRRDPSNSRVDLGVPPGFLLVLPTT